MRVFLLSVSLYYLSTETLPDFLLSEPATETLKAQISLLQENLCVKLTTQNNNITLCVMSTISWVAADVLACG